VHLLRAEPGSRDRCLVAVHLLLSSYYYPPSMGGLERQSHLLARGMVARGHEVRVIAARLEGMRDREVLDGVEVTRVSPGSGSRYRTMGTYLAGMAWCAARLGRWSDVIQVQQALYPAAAMALVAPLVGRPLVVRNSGSGRFGAVSVMSALPLGASSLQLIGRGATVVSLGREMTEELGRVPMRRVREIPNGVEVPAAISDADRAAARAALGIAPHAGVALYFGRLDEEKGVDLALEAWACAAPEGARLLIVGSGPGEAAMQAMARGMGERGARIAFFPSTSDLRPYLAAADAFVLPSHSEGISNSLLEAMAHGVASLATDVGGNRTVITSPDVGVLAPREPEVFGAALARLLGDRSAARALGERARAHVEARFSVGAMLDAYEALYTELVRGPSRSGAGAPSR
jgi:glycosyltransferase involved in cell wall biosynthesis